MLRRTYPTSGIFSRLYFTRTRIGRRVADMGK